MVGWYRRSIHRRNCAILVLVSKARLTFLSVLRGSPYPQKTQALSTPAVQTDATKLAYFPDYETRATKLKHQRDRHVSHRLRPQIPLTNGRAIGWFQSPHQELLFHLRRPVQGRQFYALLVQRAAKRSILAYYHNRQYYNPE